MIAQRSVIELRDIWDTLLPRMRTRTQIRRSIKLPDSLRVGRAERAPELGPRIVFFSGGSALRPLSRALKQYTHNSSHLITPFDSGGSSAELRKAFDMLSIGDLRNRLVALAEESVRGNPEIYRLFCYRLSKVASRDALRVELRQLTLGEHPLVLAVPQPMRHIIRTHLRFFSEQMPAGFDLRGANIGNLMLTGGYLAQQRDIDSTLFLFSKLLEVRGTVRPTVECNAHLAARLDNGREVYGQHLLTGKEAKPLESRIKDFYLIQSLDSPIPTRVVASDDVLRLIQKADLICYPMGSFYTSILANLLPAGIAQAIADTDCPKLFIPNTGTDPEQLGMTVYDCARRLLDVLRAQLPSPVPVDQLLTHVLVDLKHGVYDSPLDTQALSELEVELIDLQLRTQDSSCTDHSPAELAKVLLSLAQ